MVIVFKILENYGQQAHPAILTAKDSLGLIGRDKAIKAALKHLSLKNPPASFKFDSGIYRNEAVKLAVSELSSFKCAYCETMVSSGFDGDVEHFRPMGAVLTKSDNLKSPAYYWLAADWDNLFLACDHCNKGRRRKKEKEARWHIGNIW